MDCRARVAPYWLTSCCELGASKIRSPPAGQCGGNYGTISAKWLQSVTPISSGAENRRSEPGVDDCGPSRIDRRFGPKFYVPSESPARRRAARSSRRAERLLDLLGPLAEASSGEVSPRSHPEHEETGAWGCSDAVRSP
ncbi:hypothetical protein GCM10009726_34120 [Nocardioides furvisabuli]|uniref:Uncharacterized protein n=1 Tax=Nocardioides furvisabuli TaxID=375542 RepID=A0ABP5JBD6_9ACTN